MNPTKSYLTVFFAVTLTTLTGCANFVDVKVTRFHSLPNPNEVPIQLTTDIQSLKLPVDKPIVSKSVFNGQHFGMVKEIQAVPDLEFKQFVNTIAQEFIALGLKESEPYDFLVDFTLSSPAFIGERMQPYSTPYTRMNCFREVGGYTNCSPYTSYRTNYYPVQYTYFINQLELFIIDAKTNQRIWQGRAESNSVDQPNMAGLLPFLTRAALENFPGPSGVVETIRFNLDKK